MKFQLSYTIKPPGMYLWINGSEVAIIAHATAIKPALMRDWWTITNKQGATIMQVLASEVAERK